MNNEILEQFDKQRNRGTQGFGLFDGQELHIVRASKEKKILKWLVKYDSNLIMFHHRFPTSTINVKRAAHPISTKKYFGDTQYIMVHNGVLHNSDELFVKHQELGIEYSTMLDDLTYNDSESLLWDFALYKEGQQEKMNAKGDMACIVVKLFRGKLKEMYFFRNSRPLNLFKNKKTIELSSEGRGTPIVTERLYRWDYKKKNLTSEPIALQSWTYTPVRNYTPGYRPTEYHGTPLLGDGRPWSNNACSPYDEFNYRDEEDDEYEERYDPDTKTIYYSRKGVPELRVNEELEFKDQPASWLGEALRKKFAPLIASGQIQVGAGDAKSYKRTQGGLYVPNQSSRNEMIPVTPEEAEELIMEYMIACSGNFESSYWQMELDYEDLLNESETVENVRKQLLFEKAMAFINTDPEYINSKSVSSIWRSLWQQQEIAV